MLAAIFFEVVMENNVKSTKTPPSTSTSRPTKLNPFDKETNLKSNSAALDAVKSISDAAKSGETKNLDSKSVNGIKKNNENSFNHLLFKIKLFLHSISGYLSSVDRKGDTYLKKLFKSNDVNKLEKAWIAINKSSVRESLKIKNNDSNTIYNIVKSLPEQEQKEPFYTKLKILFKQLTEVENPSAFMTKKTPDLQKLFHTAIHDDSPEILEGLIRLELINVNKAINFDLIEPVYDGDILEIAITNNSSRIFDFCIKNKSHIKEINESNKGKESLLMLAVSRGHYGMVKQILQRKETDVNQVDTRTGYTPLMQAAKLNNSDIVELFCNHGAKVSVKNRQNENALDLATTDEIKKILTEYINK